MTQNLLIASEPDQPAESAANAEHTQDARSLIDHLSSVLSVDDDGAPPPAQDAYPAPKQGQAEAHSFTKAIMRQSDQIQYLVEQIIRLDSDTEVTRLREVVADLCVALTDVTMRMKQDTSQAAEKIGLLVEAITIIGGNPDDDDVSRTIASLLPAAKTAAERLGSVERQSYETSAAILALEHGMSRGQNKIRDLSAGLIKLNESVESSRSEIAGLGQRIGSADHALTRGLAKLGDDIEEGRNEIAGLRHRIETADHALARGLAKLGDNIEEGRNDIAGLQQRAGSVERALAQGLATLGDTVEEGRTEIAGLRQSVVSRDQLLDQGLATLNERTAALRDGLGQITERLASVEDGAAMHSVFKDKIEVLGLRLGDLERNAATEIKSWRLHESERNAALMTKLESLEQKNHSLSQGNEQMAARLNAAESTIANVVQRQKALASVHDRVVRLLLANPDLEV
jgi:phage-related tail protein